MSKMHNREELLGMDLNQYIDEHKEEIIRSVQEIVRIPSVEAGFTR